MDTPSRTRTPIEAILRSPAQTPVKGVSRDLGCDPLVGQREDDRPLHRVHEVA